MRALFTITIFLSAALLFLVEPMVARMILPSFGGSAQVWNTCLVFFQALLLAGYGYAHLTTKWLGASRQWQVHIPMMVLAAGLLAWRGLDRPTGQFTNGDPSLPLLGLLAAMIGLPFFIVSAGAPILQRWFATTDDPDANDPYFLYSASNLGSLLALLAYPVIVEPTLGLRAQGRAWEMGLGALIVAMAICVFAMRGHKSRIQEEQVVEPTAPPTRNQRLTWIFIAAIPSSLLLGVTTFLSTNIAPVPLLWVVPLAVYLITFILAFAKKKHVSSAVLGRFVAIALTVLILPIVLESSEPLIPLAILHLVTFFLTAWMCHAKLSETRPDASHLTEFYFWIAAGGVVGGIFNALVAPVVFKTLAEYPIAIVAAAFIIAPRESAAKRFVRMDAIAPVALGLLLLGIIFAVEAQGMEPSKARTAICVGLPALACFFASNRPIRFALCIGAVFLVSNATHISAEGLVVLSERSFFGVHRVTVIDHGRFYRLTHGNTIHGLQDRQNPLTPLTYYYPNGPIGTVFQKFSGPLTKKNVALVGLGVGSLAAYGQSGQQMDYYEIDPVVKQIATDPTYFTFLRDSKAKVRIIMGDARISLSQAPDSSYDMIVLDAFSSDAIPVHLLTEEAFEMYLRKLKPGGIICAHISNRYLDLSIVLGAISKDLNLVNLDDDDEDVDDAEKRIGKNPSKWIFLARAKDDFGPLNKLSLPPIDPTPGARAWTDDFSNVLSVFNPNH